MTPTLLNLALEYGWGCGTCHAVGRLPSRPTGAVMSPCPTCYGNRITPEDAKEFERKAASSLSWTKDNARRMSEGRGGDRVLDSIVARLDSLQRKGNQP